MRIRDALLKLGTEFQAERLRTITNPKKPSIPGQIIPAHQQSLPIRAHHNFVREPYDEFGNFRGNQ